MSTRQREPSWEPSLGAGRAAGSPAWGSTWRSDQASHTPHRSDGRASRKPNLSPGPELGGISTGAVPHPKPARSGPQAYLLQTGFFLHRVLGPRGQHGPTCDPAPAALPRASGRVPRKYAQGHSTRGQPERPCPGPRDARRLLLARPRVRRRRPCLDGWAPCTAARPPGRGSEGRQVLLAGLPRTPRAVSFSVSAGGARRTVDDPEKGQVPCPRAWFRRGRPTWSWGSPPAESGAGPCRRCSRWILPLGLSSWPGPSWFSGLLGPRGAPQRPPALGALNLPDAGSLTGDQPGG